MVQGVQEDDVDGLGARLVLDLGEHVDGDKARQAEGRRLV